MPRTTQKQRGIFERPKGSGIYWVCYDNSSLLVEETLCQQGCKVNRGK
ncbi:MAG TPA: hypothetical protein VMW38_09090 [Terriglobia bacterium]|nr:hypothetical protein [Terriglobia bacterium]